MRIFLNATTPRTGGGLEIATSFIRQALTADVGVDWTFGVSAQLSAELSRFNGDLPPSTLELPEPSRNLAARRQLRELVAQLGVDCVFTLIGPAYVRFTEFHVMGCANGWVTHPSWLAYNSMSLPTALRAFGRNLYRKRWFKYADAWIVQTPRAFEGIVDRLRLPPRSVFVVPHTCGEAYWQNRRATPFPQPGKTVSILCFAAPHEHKNITMLAEVAAELRRRQRELEHRIVVTLPADSAVYRELMRRAKGLNVEHVFDNRGPVPVANGSQLYQTCDLLLFPTLLETFSATYVEAMAMGLPIVTSNLGFALDVCRDAAMYFPPNDAAAAADCIVKLLASERKWTNHVRRGQCVLDSMRTPREWFETLVNRVIEAYQAAHAAPPAIQRPKLPKPHLRAPASATKPDRVM